MEPSGAFGGVAADAYAQAPLLVPGLHFRQLAEDFAQGFGLLLGRLRRKRARDPLQAYCLGFVQGVSQLEDLRKVPAGLHDMVFEVEGLQMGYGAFAEEDRFQDVLGREPGHVESQPEGRREGPEPFKQLPWRLPRRLRRLGGSGQIAFRYGFGI